MLDIATDQWPRSVRQPTKACKISSYAITCCVIQVWSQWKELCPIWTTILEKHLYKRTRSSLVHLLLAKDKSHHLYWALIHTIESRSVICNNIINRWKCLNCYLKQLRLYNISWSIYQITMIFTLANKWLWSSASSTSSQMYPNRLLIGKFKEVHIEFRLNYIVYVHQLLWILI